MDRINDVFSSTSYLIPLETFGNHDHYLLEIFFSLVLFYSMITPQSPVLAFSPSWTPKKCFHGLVYCPLLTLNSPIGFSVFPPSFMEIQLLCLPMKFLIIHVYHELASLHTNW